MKKVFLLSVLALFMISCAETLPFYSDSNKEDIQRIYKGEINDIKVSTSIDAEIIKGNDERVVLKGENHDLENVVVELENGYLNVYQESSSLISFSANKNVKVKIYVKDFETVKASSSADIEINDKFTLSSVNVEASSSGSIKGYLEANNFNIKVSSSGEFEGKIWAIDLQALVSSSGDIKVNGKAKNSIVSSSSSGDFEGKDLETQTADLRASSSGDISIRVLRELDASASSSGEIVVYSDGNLSKENIRESSSGNVQLKN